MTYGSLAQREVTSSAVKDSIITQIAALTLIIPVPLDTLNGLAEETRFKQAAIGSERYRSSDCLVLLQQKGKHTAKMKREHILDQQRNFDC